MKVIVRIFGLNIMMFYVILIFLQMMDYNVRRDELNHCISMAMTNTQIIMAENIEDTLYGTNNHRKSIESNNEYIEEFACNFHVLVTTNTKYEIYVYAIDYTTGLLSVEVEGTFLTINGVEKKFRSRKTSVVEVVNI